MEVGTFEHFKTIVIFVFKSQESIASPSQFHKMGNFSFIVWDGVALLIKFLLNFCSYD